MKLFFCPLVSKQPLLRPKIATNRWNLRQRLVLKDRLTPEAQHVAARKVKTHD